MFELMSWFGVVVLMSFESIAIIIPAEIIMPLAGWRLVADQDLGFPYILLVGLLGAVGSTIGSLGQYFLARAGGRPVIERYGRYMLVTRKDLDRADRWFATRGDMTIFIARLVPGIRAIISIPAGVARMNVLKFSFFTLIGSFPWTFGLAWAGAALGENYEDIREVMEPVDIPFLAIMALLIIWFLWRRIREIRREGAEVRQARMSEGSDGD